MVNIKTQHKHILMLTHDVIIDRRILLQANALADLGHKVTIIAQGSKSTKVNSIPGIDIHLLTNNNKASENLLHWPMKAYKQLTKYFSHKILLYPRAILLATIYNPVRVMKHLYLKTALQYDADIIVAHDLPMLPIAYEYKKIKENVKVVYDSHELYPYQEFSKLESTLWQKVESQYISCADLITTINTSIAKQMENNYRNTKVYVLENTVPEYRKSIEKNNYLQDKFNIDNQSKIILYQGNITAYKNLRNVIKCFDLVKDKNCHLILLGNGPYLNNLKEMANKTVSHNRIHFHDSVKQQDLLEITSCADYGIIPYNNTCLNNYYCTPNKLYEFIQAELPIIAPNYPELTKIIDNQIGITGDFTTTTNIAKLIDRLEQADYLRFMKNLSQLKQEKNWEKTKDQLITLYQNHLLCA